MLRIRILLRVATFALISMTAVSALASRAARLGYHFGGGQDVVGLYQGGVFLIKDNPASPLRTIYFGNAGDSPLAADFDGDGKTDLAIYRPDTRTFWWRRSSDGAVGASTFGDSTDFPVAADFDGDGKTDIAVYRPATSQYWYIKSSDQSIASTVTVGAINGKPRPGLVPFIGDFNGDGRSDPGAFDTENSTFYWATGGGAYGRTITGVSKAAIPVIGNFESANFTNLGVYDFSTRKFVYVDQAGNQVAVALGAAGDTPLTADFDGDGKADFAVFSTKGTSATISYIASSTGALATVSFGSSTSYSQAQPLSLPYFQPAWTGAPSEPMTNSPDAPQTIYRAGVPHVTTANVRQTAPGADSFIPLCLYHPFQGAWGGMSPAYDGFTEAAAAKFNCIQTPYGVNAQDASDYSNLYQAAAEKGLRVIREFHVVPDTTSAIQTPSELAQMSVILQHVNQYKSVKNLMAWKLDEEAACSGASEAKRWSNFTYLLQKIAIADPVHPSIAVDTAFPIAGCSVVPWENWNASVKIKIPAQDNYQFRLGTEGSLAQNNNGHLGIPDSITKTVTYKAGAETTPRNEGKPIWYTVQAFEQISDRMPRSLDFKMPTHDQMRAQVYAALTHGATGLMYFVYDSYASRQARVIGISPNAVASYPNDLGKVIASQEQTNASRALWNTVAALNSEITRLQGAWLSNTSLRSYQVSIQSNRSPYSTTPIRSMLKRDPNGLYTLFVVNLDNQSINAKFDFQGARLVNLRKISSDGNFLPVVGINAFADRFKPFEVWIYQFMCDD